MSISKDVKMSYFALPKLPEFHSDKGVNEHGKKLGVDNIGQVCK